MDQTTNLKLPYIMPSQAQKQVTHNEALRALDAIVQLAVLDRDLTLPPASPADGDRYIVAAGATGGWSGKDQQVAAWQDGAWAFFAPGPGWTAFVTDEAGLVYWGDGSWARLESAISVLQNLSLLGIGTTADATNAFAAKLNKALWTARYSADGGDGDLRYTLNKASAGNTLSLLMQTDYSGRAELGLVGDDDLAIKVSPDGATWTEALKVDRSTGATTVKGLADATTGKPLVSMIFTPGGDGAVSIWRNDTTRAKDPRTASISSVAGDVVTLSTATASLFYQNAQMAGVSYLRIWNTSKTAPGAPAWVKYVPATNQLQVTDATAIADWAAGETIQVGDPTPSIAPTRAFALDVSPMLQNVLGAVFPQAGILAKISAQGNSAAIDLAASGTAGSGSFVATYSMTTGAINSGLVVVQTSVLSPISNSNLVFLREDATGSADIKTTLVSVVGVYV